MYTRILVATAIVMGALGLPRPATGHQQTVKHQAIVQVQTDHSEMLVLYEVSGGQRAQLLRTIWDQNLDGTLDSDEREALARHLGAIALAGVSLTRNEETLDLEGGDWRLEVDPEPDGPIVVALLLQLDGGPGEYRLAMSKDADGTSGLTVELEVGTGLTLSNVTGATVSDGIGAGPLVLLPDDAIGFEVKTAE